ncbi:hypothetical Protein YC6258_01742 [Gynuella sunshinyii YC6258]|uniref:Uncharacterized protein n=1 Tax=Gynuella sunshinyii YC6258 TaxID=1445510 RepID=A0A0C5VHS1_9GAMM|nr:hypothetical Protein YC6258_01742 [Gynuella sunshinyii YC6258]
MAEHHLLPYQSWLAPIVCMPDPDVFYPSGMISLEQTPMNLAFF